MTIEDVLKSLLNSGPGYTLVGAILFIARQIWMWLWDKTIDPETKEMKGPAAQWLREYTLTQQEMRKSIIDTATTVSGGKVVDERHTASLLSIESTIKNIEEQLATINKFEQSVSTQRILKMLISTMLELAQQAGIDVTQHRTKFIGFLQDNA